MELKALHQQHIWWIHWTDLWNNELEATVLRPWFAGLVHLGCFCACRLGSRICAWGCHIARCAERHFPTLSRYFEAMREAICIHIGQGGAMFSSFMFDLPYIYTHVCIYLYILCMCIYIHIIICTVYESSLLLVDLNGMTLGNVWNILRPHFGYWWEPLVGCGWKINNHLPLPEARDQYSFWKRDTGVWQRVTHRTYVMY